LIDAAVQGSLVEEGIINESGRETVADEDTTTEGETERPQDEDDVERALLADKTGPVSQLSPSASYASFLHEERAEEATRERETENESGNATGEAIAKKAENTES